jgi:GR25 family glycosyltransferase involved in LPS biosynthesis
MIDLFVINLIDCIHRKNQIIQDFLQYNEIRLNFIEGIRNENGGIGCFLSFKKCIRLAKERGMKYIIILEDDCLPRNNFQNRLKKAISYLESNLNNWNIFLGGVLKCNRIIDKISYLDENFYYICRAHSAHLFICNSNIYDILLEVDENKYAVDTFWHKKYNVCIFLPFLAYQRNGQSNIGKKYYGTLIDDYTRTEKYLINYLDKNINWILSKNDHIYINNIDYIKNKLYEWNNLNIRFLDDLKIDFFEKSYYKIIDNYNIIAYFNNIEHSIKFNNDYTEFISIRKDDLFIIYGKILLIENNIINKTYKWEDTSIKFLDNLKMDAFGESYYKVIDDYNIIAYIGKKEHNIKFSDNYTYFVSIRNDDSYIIYGKLLITENNIIENNVNKINNINSIIKKKYKWNESFIKFLDYIRMNAFGKGYYKVIDNYNIIAYFGKREHNIKFNDDYTEFISIRKGDLCIVFGKIMIE